MVAKLKSILKTAPWSLVSKAVAAGLLWVYAPWWAFALFACALFFAQLFRSFLILPSFIVLMWLSFVMPNDIFWGFFITIGLFIILGVKNLILIKRTGAYEFLIAILFFMTSVWFFSNANMWNEKNMGLLAGMVPGVIFFTLLYGFSRYFYLQAQEGIASPNTLRDRSSAAIVGGLSLLLWEGAVALLFLPITFFYQASLLFLSCALLTELFTDYMKRRLTQHKLLLLGTVFFAISVLLLASTEWGM